MRDKIGTVGKVSSVLILVSIIYYSVQRSNEIKSGIKNRHALTIGHIEDGSTSAKTSGISLWYSYYYKGKKYEHGTIGYTWINGLDWTSVFLNKYFPVVVDSLNPQHADILLSKGRFNAYGYGFPDSLKWVERYVE